MNQQSMFTISATAGASRKGLSLLLATLLGLSFVPQLAQAKQTDAAPSPYEPPQKRLRQDRSKAPETKVELTDTGKALADKYAAMLSELQADLNKQVPQIDEARQQALRHALAAQKLAGVVYENAHRSWRRGYYWKSIAPKSLEQALEAAPARLAAAELLLKNAQAMPDGHEDKARAMEEALKNLENRKRDLAELPGKLAKARDALEAARKNEPELNKPVEAAAKALQDAKAATRQALDDLRVDDLLASDALDAKLAKFMVLSDATPYWLAAYAQQGPEQEQIVEQLLANQQLMLQMLVADGPMWEKYGRAMEIYQAIQKASPRASEGLFQRMALAVALEHAVPVRLEVIGEGGEDDEAPQPDAEAAAPQYADPVQRYLSYEKAYLNDELDAGFKGLSTWDLKLVVNGTEPDEISAWGRAMLRSYRPDLVTMDDYDWRYVKSVVTEINYTSAYQKLGWDRPDLQRYQNILANGGICGRRAFFGRFILRAFGIPTTARPQPGHAALVHWTPHGWVPCLGGGWGASNRSMIGYPTDLDLLASTQAREDAQAFMKVKRAQWAGRVRGEPSSYGYHENLGGREVGKYVKKTVEEVEVPAFWHAVALITQDQIIRGLNVQPREAAGEDLGESDESGGGGEPAQVTIPEADRKITVDGAGAIHIPAAACSAPTNNTSDILFMPSNLGGMQLHHTRYGGASTFEYTFDAPAAGKYMLTARLVTPAPKQHLFLNVNSSSQRIDIALPYTIGLWGELDPVEIELKQGQNVLTFSRGHYFMRGVTIRDFTLTPVR